MDCVVQLLQQSYSGNEIEVHEAEQKLLSIDITCDFIKILFDIIKSNIEISIKYSALIRLIYIIKQKWEVSLSNDAKFILFYNYLELLYSDGPKYNKLFQFFSNLIIEAVMTLKECPNIYSQIKLDNDQIIPSLILLKSMARHFLHCTKNNEQFSQFCIFFFQSTFRAFVDSQSFDVIILFYNSFYYIIRNDPSFLMNSNSLILVDIISKFFFFSEIKDDEIYQQGLKCASKTIYLIFTKSIVPNDISADLLIRLFNTSFQLYSKDLKPNTRNQLTRLICVLFSLQLITRHFFNNLQYFIESFILPFFMTTDIKGDLYDDIFDLYDPYHSSIYIIQYLSRNYPDFINFLNAYLAQSIQYFLTLTNSNDTTQLNNEAKFLLARTKLSCCSRCIENESLLQIPLFNSTSEILRVVAFTITANFCEVLPPFLFPICMDHFTDESSAVCHLSAISAIKCLQNEELDISESSNLCLSRFFESYLIVSQNIELVSIWSSLELLEKLVDISGSPGVFTDPILSSLLSNLIQLSNDPNSDPSVAEKVTDIICQILELNSMNQECEYSADPFITELISMYRNFNGLYKENILSIFEVSVECYFSPTVSWKILSVFEFDMVFENEMMFLKKLLISAKNHSAFDMSAIQFLFDKLFQKIGNDSFDDKIALNSLADIISLLFGLDEESIDSLIIQRLIPLILERIQMNASISAVSQLISCIFIFFQKCEKQFDYQPFINFWIENAEYPYFCASSISIIQNLFSDSNLCLQILLEVCDELSDFYNKGDQQQISDEFEFDEFSFSTIITNFLKLIKFLKEQFPDFYQLFHSNAETFLDEELPQIVDSICS